MYEFPPSFISRAAAWLSIIVREVAWLSKSKVPPCAKTKLPAAESVNAPELVEIVSDDPVTTMLPDFS